MYEIWLALNIVWEIALGIWPWLVGAMLVWLALLALASRRPGLQWRAALPGVALAGTVGAVLAVLGVPTLLQSSLSELRYWVDWANLTAIALAVALVIGAFAWPLIALRSAGGR